MLTLRVLLLHAHNCTALQDLQSRVELLREPLQYFNSLEELGVQLGMPLIGGTAAQSAHISGPKVQLASIHLYIYM
jgi:arginine decarboxylase-like protein